MQANISLRGSGRDVTGRWKGITESDMIAFHLRTGNAGGSLRLAILCKDYSLAAHDLHHFVSLDGLIELGCHRWSPSEANSLLL